MYLFDTNVISEIRKRTRSDPRVAAWARTIDQNSVFLSAISLQEIEIGVLQIERHDRLQGEVLRAWAEQIRLNFRGRILPVDERVALRSAALHVPDKRPDRDALIGATALIHGLALVTRNTADFEPMGVPLFNPWLAESRSVSEEPEPQADTAARRKHSGA